MDQEAWNTKRKIWHIGGCLSMLPVYFLWRDIVFPLHWLNFPLCLSWLLAGVCLAIDLLRFYFPDENIAFKRLPFYGSILRKHEHTGYNASTYCFTAIAILITGLYCGFVSEGVLVATILLIALADPAAALARVVFFKLGQAYARWLGLMAFTGVAILSATPIFLWYGNLNWLAIVSASVFTAIIEAYVGNFWNNFRPLIARAGLRTPVFVSVFYPDDNFVAPLFFALILMLFGL